MRRKILAAIVAAAMTDVKPTDDKSVNKAEKGVNSSKEVQEEINETIVEETIVEETVVEEIHNKYMYEFEGKYWLRYSQYGHIGWHFDGFVATCQMENHAIYSKDYFVEGNLINIGEEYYRYEVLEGKLGLVLARDSYGDYAYYEEVDKGEYDSLFN